MNILIRPVQRLRTWIFLIVKKKKQKLTREGVVGRRSGSAAHGPLVSYGFRAQKELPSALRRSRTTYKNRRTNETTTTLISMYLKCYVIVAIFLNFFLFLFRSRTLSHDFVQVPVWPREPAGRVAEFLGTLSRLCNKKIIRQIAFD